MTWQFTAALLLRDAMMIGLPARDASPRLRPAGGALHRQDRDVHPPVRVPGAAAGACARRPPVDVLLRLRLGARVVGRSSSTGSPAGSMSSRPSMPSAGGRTHRRAWPRHEPRCMDRPRRRVAPRLGFRRRVSRQRQPRHRPRPPVGASRSAGTTRAAAPSPGATPRASVDFLTELFRNPLDAGYGDAAERPRPVRAARPGRAAHRIHLAYGHVDRDRCAARGRLSADGRDAAGGGQDARQSGPGRVQQRQAETDAQQKQAEQLRQQAASLRDAIVGPNSTALDQIEARPASAPSPATESRSRWPVDRRRPTR